MNRSAANEADSRLARFVERSIGENLDQLICMDMRGDGLSRTLMTAARSQIDGPMTTTAASALASKIQPGDRVLMLTGFIVPPWNLGETDGLIGAVVLGRALEAACGALPVFVCEPEIHPPLEAGFRAAGLQVYRSLEEAHGLTHSVVLLPFPKDHASARRRAEQLAGDIDPVACVAIERPGANAQGEYHFAQGRNVTEWIAPIDVLYQEVAARGALMVAVGDFGNELGMGSIIDTVERETPAGGNCGCGCGGGTACPVPADVVVACSVSDWGAYAVAAALAHISDNPFAYVDATTYERVLFATVAGGCLDGDSQYAIPYVDGIDDRYNVRLIDTLRDVIRYVADPKRSAKFSAIRAFRAERG